VILEGFMGILSRSNKEADWKSLGESGHRLWFKPAMDEPVIGSSKIFPMERTDRKI
jgi:hypothetical protein